MDEAGGGRSRDDGAARIDALDGLRGVAAIGVLLHHVQLPPTGFASGYLAVDFFFLLSGYVIGRAYEGRLAGGLSVPAYMLQRLERLYPMIFIGGVLGFLTWSANIPDGYFVPAGEIDMVAALASQFLLIPFLVSRTEYAHNIAQWSILFELGVNLLHALLRPLLRDWVLAGIVIANGAWLILLATRYWTIDFGWGIDNVVRAIPRVLFGFSLGLLLFRRERTWLPHVPVLPFWLLVLLLLLLLGLPPLSVWKPAEQYRDPAIVILLFPLLFMAGRAARGMARLSQALGALSYPLYLLQGPLVGVAFSIVTDTGIIHGPWFLPVLIVGGSALIGFSWLVAIYVDEPLNAWRRAARRRREQHRAS